MFFGLMFVCSLCSARANAAVFASVRISDPVHRLICYGRRLKLVDSHPILLNQLARSSSPVIPGNSRPRFLQVAPVVSHAYPCAGG